MGMWFLITYGALHAGATRVCDYSTRLGTESTNKSDLYIAKNSTASYHSIVQIANKQTKIEVAAL